MPNIRDFSSSNEFQPPARTIDSDAPQGMRQELIDLFFYLMEHRAPLHVERLYQIICQSLGVSASGNPYSGYRHAAGRDFGNTDWRRVYDLICRLWPEFLLRDLNADYHLGVNRILSANGVVWELSEEGQLQRHLPLEAQPLISATIAELNAPRFAPALSLLNAARDAFNAVPRRERDACSNIFDSMESVAKEVFNMPDSTFGAVIASVRNSGTLNGQVISVLEAINTLRNRNFGHGMTDPFNLSSKEVDFTYLTCIGAILLFARI